jgi:hypothetical protein
LFSSIAEGIDIIKHNLHLVNWNLLSYNRNAIPILLLNFDKIDWQILSKNPAAIDILKENRYSCISSNLLLN